jgi:hypothetical protein
MKTVNIKKSLIKKTITNLKADITRKGTWAYQNALALESVVGSDAYLNDKVETAEDLHNRILNVKKEVSLDTKLNNYEGYLPNRSSEGQYFKELSNGDLAFFDRGEEKYIFVSRDKGSTWEVILDISNLAPNEKTMGLETGYFDVEYINGHYMIAWSGTSNSTERIFL